MVKTGSLFGMLLALTGSPLGRPSDDEARGFAALRCDTVATPSPDGPGQIRLVAVGAKGQLAWIEGVSEKSVIARAASGARQVIGRSGSGPGEFQTISMLSWRGDTLWVSDARLSRLQGFSIDGKLLASIRTPVIGRFVARPDGSFLTSVAGYPPAQAGHPVEIDPGRTPLMLVSFHPPTATLDTLLRAEPVPNPVKGSLPEFNVRLMSAMSNDGQYGCVVGATAGLTFQLHCIDGPGRSYLQGERQLPERPMTDALWTTVTTALADENHSSLDEILTIFTRPKALPQALAILVNSNGDVWLRRSAVHEETALWDRVGRNGTAMSRITLPGRMQLQQLDGDRMYAADTDRDGFQRLVRCRVQD